MRIFLSLLLLMLCLSFWAQPTMPAVSQGAWKKLVALGKNASFLKPEDYAAYPVYPLRGGLYLSMMGKVHSSPDWDALTSLGVLRGSTVGNIATIKIPLSLLADVPLESVFEYIEIPGRVFPHLDKAVKDTRADSVQQGIGLPQAYTGEDVLIGVTDWGFDYTHPMFYDALLQETRIVAAWEGTGYFHVGRNRASF